MQPELDVLVVVVANVIVYAGFELRESKKLERKVRELKKASEILPLASAYFAQAQLDRRPKS